MLLLTSYLVVFLVFPLVQLVLALHSGLAIGSIPCFFSSLFAVLLRPNQALPSSSVELAVVGVRLLLL
jgi:hypothetical protein